MRITKRPLADEVGAARAKLNTLALLEMTTIAPELKSEIDQTRAAIKERLRKAMKQEREA